jgi:hypothetical protein
VFEETDCILVKQCVFISINIAAAAAAAAATTTTTTLYYFLV